jgi:5-methylcytosine-specific restriction endonuclease McrA
MCKLCLSKRYRKTRRAYEKENREKRQEKSKRYRAEHTEYVKRYSARRRARKAGAEGRHTDAEWLALCESFGNRCLRCGAKNRPLTRDHIIPLSLGGSDYITNIQPLCAGCNGGKRDRVIDYRKGKPMVEPPLPRRERPQEPPTDRSKMARLSVPEAATALGVSVEAIRGRIKRSTIPYEREGDRVYVLLDTDQSRPGRRQDADQSDRDELVDELRDRISYLERQVEEEREARRRADTLLARAMDAIPALEASQSHENAAEGVAEGQPVAQGQPTSSSDEPRSWWQFWK